MRLPQGEYVTERDPQGASEPAEAAPSLTVERLRAVEERRRELIRRSFLPFDPVAAGTAAAVVLGAGLSLATAVLVVRGGQQVGKNLRVLDSFFPGYTVSWSGALLGLLYAALFGFALGFLAAWFRNLGLRVVLWRAAWQADRWRRRHMLDEI